MRGSELNQEILGEMADEIAGLLRGRSGLLDDTELITNVGTVATGNGIVVQVLVSDTVGNALLSVSVKWRASRKSVPPHNCP